LDETLISRAITETYMKDLLSHLNVDVAIAGAGPSGLVCAYYLAKKGVKVAMFERHLKIGGGMPGGGMMFNKIVVQKEAKFILDEFGITAKKYKKDLYVLNAIEAAALLTAKAVKKGVAIFNLMTVEDVMIRKGRISGAVLNWSPVDIARIHVDPLAVKAKAVVDATGHDSEVARIVERKIGPELITSTGGVIGEKSMWAEVGERKLVENTKEVYPGLVTCGMAANAVFGSPRMGAIFGGMLLSGRRAAEVIKKIIK